jgi:exonuclease SbcD
LVGGTSEVPASLFEGFTYVALGHLHTFQPVVESNIYYSGSPLPYSFSETDPKKVILIDLDAEGIASIEEVPCTIGRRAKVLTASLDDLLSDPVHGEFEDHFVLAKLTDSARTFDARERLEARFPHLVRIEWVGLSEIQHERADAKATDSERIEKFLRTTLGEEFSEEHLQLVLDEYVAVVVEGQVG